MKLTKIDSYEIQAFAFRVMTGYVAPGKDASPLADEASYEERCAAFDEWRNEHAPCILAMLHGFEALIDRNDEPTRALLDRLDAAERENESIRDILLRNGFVECDIPACNCGSWHHRYGLPERLREIKDALADAGHEPSNANGNTAIGALNELIEQRDAAEAENERLRDLLARTLGGHRDLDLQDAIIAALDAARREK